MVKTRDDFIRAGQRFSTPDVLDEGRQTVARWAEDLAVLTPWGWGTSRHERLKALVDSLDTQHQKALAQRGAKLSATPENLDAMDAARAWAERALSVLDDLIAQDEDIALKVQVLGALPDLTTASELQSFAAGIMGIAQTQRDRLDDAADDAFFTSGQDTIDTLLATFEGRTITTEAKLTGTVQLDEADGRVHDFIKRLNHNARRALRRAGQHERAALYKFHILTNNPNDNTSTPQNPDSPSTPINPTP